MHTQSTESEPVLSERPLPEERPLLRKVDRSRLEERPLLRKVDRSRLGERLLLEEPRLRQREVDPKRDNMIYYIFLDIIKCHVSLLHPEEKLHPKKEEDPVNLLRLEERLHPRKEEDLVNLLLPEERLHLRKEEGLVRLLPEERI